MFRCKQVLLSPVLVDIEVTRVAGSFDYGYEYMGLNERLVITPLTERINLSITQALSMHLGSALAGNCYTFLRGKL